MPDSPLSLFSGSSRTHFHRISARQTFSRRSALSAAFPLCTFPFSAPTWMIIDRKSEIVNSICVIYSERVRRKREQPAHEKGRASALPVLSDIQKIAVGSQCTIRIVCKNPLCQDLSKLYTFLIEAVQIPEEALEHDLVLKVSKQCTH